eukprot:NODE_2876_length_1022_cov_10.214800_g2409_i0.p8 GENE.NODE_2876_length_1022_cov_10.214800_g2409_i0~~NODE_2876_length_1022_cov_10.214800_g2409_i0.p8  ORF type:complete len:60 (-),score=3.25 NODE_2876_length_1022_cov_10.214800_g2409_i0:408-587(-)
MHELYGLLAGRGLRADRATHAPAGASQGPEGPGWAAARARKALAADIWPPARSEKASRA